MADKVELSSSEQYVKKSNRRLLLVGVIALLAFLFGLVVLTSSGSRRNVDADTPVIKNEELPVTTPTNEIYDFNRDASGALNLSAYPENVSMTGVVLGSSAEAVITLTAKGGPIRIEAMDLAQEQADGFTISKPANCTIGTVLPAGSSCNIQILWNPITVRSYSNYLTIKWRLDDPTVFPVPEQQSVKIDITGQSTDSKDCVICETKEADRIAALKGTLDESTNLYVKNDEIMGVIELDRIAISNTGSLLGRVTKDSGEVIDADGQVFARVLGDGTVITKDLEILGGALSLASVLDSSGRVIGQLTAEGTVVDATNKVIGLPMADGSVVDNTDSRIIGSVMPWGVVLNLSAKAVGGTQMDGTVVLANGQKMGRVLPGGLVVNDDGAIVGGVVANGLAVGASCQSLGKVAGNGKIYNAFDQQVGYTSIDGLVMDMNGVPVGHVIPEGVVTNLKGETIAFVNSEGKAVASDASIIGCVNPDTSVSSGQDVIGSVMPKGRVIGYDRQIKGVVLPNGSVVDSSGTAIGAVMNSGYVTDFNNKTLGAVVPKGTAVAPGCVFLGILDLNGQVLDEKGVAIGAINPDKIVFNKSNEMIGHITPMGSVSDSTGKFVGYVLPTGKVINKSGQVIGCVNPDGTVVDAKGNVLGTVSELGVALSADGVPSSVVGTIVNGKLINELGEIIGFIPPEGIVVAQNGEFLGRFSRKIGYAVDVNGNKIARILPDLTAVSVSDSNVLGTLIADGTQVLNIKNNRIGSVQGDGEVLDDNGKLLGRIHADGTVFSDDGKYVGSAMPTGTVLDWNGNVIGSVQPSGQVINQSQKQIGIVALNKTVLDGKGQVIGMTFPEVSIPLGDKGQVIGALTVDGKINKNGKPFAHITPAGNVFANNGEQVAALVRLGSVIGNDGQIQGWVTFDGQMQSKVNFEAAGQMMPDGVAVNSAHMQTGHVIPRSAVIDLKGNFAGMASVDGRLIDRAGQAQGAFLYDNRLISTSNVWVGRALKPGVALDASGQLLGYTRYDGKIINGQSQVLGTVRFDDRVINSKNEVIGQYVPYGQLFFDQKGKVVGAMSFDGAVRDGKGSEIGRLVGATVINKSNDVVGHTFNAGFAINEQGKVIGHIFPNAQSVADVDGVEEILTLTTSGRLVDKNRQIVGGAVPFGVAYNLDLSSAGNLIEDGSVLRGTELTGKSLADSILYDSLNKVMGGVIAPSVILGRDGRIVASTGVSSSVMDFSDKKVGSLLPFGKSLNTQNVLIGMTMPTGVVVDDSAKIVGFVAADGSVVKADGAMSGRVMQDGTVVRLLSRDAYGVMPDFADVVESGVAVALKNELLGRAMPSGDVLDTSNKKIASVLDDATLLGSDGQLIGALVGWRTAIDHTSIIIGNVTGDGYVTNIQGTKVGVLASNGAIKGKHQLKTVGAIIPKELVAKECRVQGQVSYDGHVINGDGKIVGTISMDGTARDDKGNFLGAVVLKGSVIANGDKGEILGRTLPDADVVNMDGVSIGCAREDGTVVDKNNNVIGTVMKRGLVVDADGKVLGRVLRDGRVVDVNGDTIGKVLADGSVIGKNGQTIGHVVDIKKNHLLYDDNNNIAGSMDKAGKVFDNNGRHLFTVSAEDKLFDPNGNLIGSVDDKGNILDLSGNVIGTATNLPHYMYDSNGNVSGYLMGDKLFDLQGKQTGWIDKDGNIYDLNGTLIGKVNPDGSVTWFNEDGTCANAKYNGKVHDTQGNLLYTIKCGKVFDKNGKVIGYIDELGRLFDLNNNYLGQIDGNGQFFDADGNLSGQWTADATDGCINAKYNGKVHDTQGNLLYTIKCGKVYDKNGKQIGWVDSDGSLYDLNGNYMGHIDEDGNVYDADDNLIGRLYPDLSSGFVSGSRNLFGGMGLGGFGGPAGSLGASSFAGRKIAINDKAFTVSADNMILNDKNEIVGKLVNGVPYGMSGNLLSDEMNATGYPTGATGYPQEQLQFDPTQAMAMRELLARKRAEQKQGVGQTLAKITPDARVLARAKQKAAKDFGSKTVSSWPVDMSRMILKDKAIPAVLTRSIDSRYPNVPASAIVERNVYAEDGRNIIIPAGSKLIGSFSGGAGTNHVSKLAITWERLIRPDGSQFKMSAVSGDAQGRGGVAAYLDELWLAKYGKPLMLSTLTSAVSYITAADESVTTNQDYGTQTESDRAEAARDARENFIDTMEQIFQQMIEESSSTPPVVFVPSGTRMTVFAMEDLWLRSEEDDVDDYEKEYGADPKSAFLPQGGGLQRRPVNPMPAQQSGYADTGVTAAGADEEYYDPGYTGEDEEEIYTPASQRADTTVVAEKPAKKEPDLNSVYRSRQGLGEKSKNEGTSTPLQQQKSSGSGYSRGSLY